MLQGNFDREIVDTVRSSTRYTVHRIPADIQIGYREQWLLGFMLISDWLLG